MLLLNALLTAASLGGAILLVLSAYARTTKRELHFSFTLTELMVLLACLLVAGACLSVLYQSLAP